MSRITELQLSRICVLLQAEDKIRRKRALEDLVQSIFKTEVPWEATDLLEIWQSIHRQVTRLLNDQVEVCRDLTIEILKKFLIALPAHDKNIVYVIPILTKRLASQELIEPSEEVRLNSVSLLRIIISKYKDHLSIYMDDVIAILAKTVTDNYPNVKKESSECISELATLIPRHFYSRSENLVKPILSNFTHQHYKVRVASVKTIGVLIQYGNSKSVEEVATPMAERLFDQSGAVRAAVVEVAGLWLVKLNDRYSWWHKLIPLVMTGLHDEIEVIRNRAAELWDAAGRLYMQENESDEKFKDKMDFLIDDPEHYPPNVIRPNLGCRVIAQQNLCKLVGGIGAELGDWMADIRVRSAQLLCVLVLNVEQDVTQHIEKLLPSMYRACNDEDRRVVENVELAAEYLGYFVPPDIYCHLVLPTLEEILTAGHLRVFAAILRGSQRKTLVPKLEQIGNFLEQSHICQSKKSSYQEQILRCCESLLTVCEEDCSTISQSLFTIIFTVLSTATEEKLQKEGERQLEMLVKIEELTDIDELYLYHIRPLLLTIRINCESWTIHSAEFHIFWACLVRAGLAAAHHLDLILPILKETMKDNTDPELRLKQFILLSDYFLCRSETFQHAENLFEIVNTILENIIIPGLIWSAGRTAEAIRTAAVCCLCALLNENTHYSINEDSKEEQNQFVMTNDRREKTNIRKVQLFSTVEHFSTLFQRIVPILVTLIDDNAKKTRLYALRAVYLIMIIGERLFCITEEHIHRTYPVILKRLDDGCDDVRCAAVEALTAVWKTVPKDYDLVFSKSHIDALYTSAIVHLDDPDSKFQEFMLEALMQLAKVHPELLARKIQNCKSNFRNQTGLNRLLEHTHKLLSVTMK